MNISFDTKKVAVTVVLVGIAVTALCVVMIVVYNNVVTNGDQHVANNSSLIESAVLDYYGTTTLKVVGGEGFWDIYSESFRVSPNKKYVLYEVMLTTTGVFNVYDSEHNTTYTVEGFSLPKRELYWTKENTLVGWEQSPYDCTTTSACPIKHYRSVSGDEPWKIETNTPTIN